MTMIMSDELLTLPEAAEVLDVPVSTLRAWRYAGTGPVSFKVGKRVRFYRSDLDAWVRAKRDTAAAGWDSYVDA